MKARDELLRFSAGSGVGTSMSEVDESNLSRADERGGWVQRGFYATPGGDPEFYRGGNLSGQLPFDSEVLSDCRSPGIRCALGYTCVRDTAERAYWVPTRPDATKLLPGWCALATPRRDVNHDGEVTNVVTTQELGSTDVESRFNLSRDCEFVPRSAEDTARGYWFLRAHAGECGGSGAGPPKPALLREERYFVTLPPTFATAPDGAPLPRTAAVGAPACLGMFSAGSGTRLDVASLTRDEATGMAFYQLWYPLSREASGCFWVPAPSVAHTGFGYRDTAEDRNDFAAMVLPSWSLGPSPGPGGVCDFDRPPDLEGPVNAPGRYNGRNSGFGSAGGDFVLPVYLIAPSSGI